MKREWIDYSHEVKVARNPAMKWLLITLGGIFFILGILGILLPVVPGIPFFVLAALCWAKVSTKFYNGMMNHRHLGPALRRWKTNQSSSNQSSKT